MYISLNRMLCTIKCIANAIRKHEKLLIIKLIVNIVYINIYILYCSIAQTISCIFTLGICKSYQADMVVMMTFPSKLKIHADIVQR